MSALTFVVLGGDGDLARRLLLPGLAQYMAEDPELEVHLVGVGPTHPGDYQAAVAEALAATDAPPASVDRLVQRTSWVRADATSSADLGALLSPLTA